MGRQEILTTRYGELLDLISCLAIYSGSAEPAGQSRTLSIDESLEVM